MPKLRKNVAKKATKQEQVPLLNVPRGAIPHIINQDILDNLKAIFEGQREVHKVLEEIRDELKRE